LFEGSKDMAWQVSASGFLMTLSSYIPKLIEVGIKDLLLKALEKNNLKLSEIDHWAIHPGGRRILEVIHDELELSESDLSSSYKVLNDYGNMSSPTILFVLKDILESKIERNSQQKVFGVAFGPGLTMESFILTYVQN
jgi:predicted naringenin-chalcone synthase